MSLIMSWFFGLMCISKELFMELLKLDIVGVFLIGVDNLIEIIEFIDDVVGKEKFGYVKFEEL